MTSPVDHDQVFGAPDEPIRRQRQAVNALENIAGLISYQTESLDTQHQQILGALKYLARIGWLVAALTALYVVRHW